MQARQAAIRVQGVRRRRHMRAWQGARQTDEKSAAAAPYRQGAQPMQRMRRRRRMRARQGAQPMPMWECGGGSICEHGRRRDSRQMQGRSVAASAYVSTAGGASDAKIAKPALCSR
eukprot:1065395-Prymnesium_polylepis.1